MKMIWKQVLWAGMLGLIVPSFCLSLAVGWSERSSAGNADTAGTETEPMATAAETTEQPTRADVMISLQLADGTVEQIGLEEYLSGVVLAEMPAQFESEALKAQSVVARTYTLRHMQMGSKHDGADVCVDSTCCQGYKSPAEYLSAGGEEADVEKICQAVQDTAGKVLTYEGELIEATYFSCSGGTTEDALAVWGTDIPYLQSTDSPGEENATHYEDSVTFTAEEFENALGTDLSGPPASWLGRMTYTTGGGVNTIVIGGKTYKGTEIRALLGLRSTDFTISATESEIEVVTHGYGHRVGMSQYGADAMAMAGSDYAEILAHYYAGTELADYDP